MCRQMGTRPTTASRRSAAAADAGIEFDASYAANGGGHDRPSGSGGDGGLCGVAGSAAGGSGAQAILVITVAPTVGNSITADASMTMELDCRVSQGSITAAEWPVLSKADQLADLEDAAAMAVNSGVVSDLAGEVISGWALHAEGLCNAASEATLPLASLIVLCRDTPVALDAFTSGMGVRRSELLFQEWLDPPNPMVISIDRLLRSPGRIRVLAGGISSSPTRGR
jgi:hypothetical protein